MKKKILILGTLLIAFCSYELADACIAETTCSGGETIACYGVSECLSAPTWVRCDQNQTSYCNKHEQE